MKAIVLTSLLTLCLSGGCRAQAQGTFYSGNYFGGPFPINAPIFDAFGTPLEGPLFLAALYATQDFESPLDSLQPSIALPFRTGEAAGYFGPELVSFGNVLPDLEAIVQIRAWDSRLAATYEEVVALGVGGYGESALLSTVAGGRTAVPGIPYGLESFSLRAVVPEPNTLLLGLVGAPLLILAMQRTRPRPKSVEATADLQHRRP